VNDEHEHCAVCERRYATATAAADAAAQALGYMAAKCSALLVERDELRATLDAERAQWIKETRHAARRIGEGARERDRLRDELAVYRDQALPDAGRIMNGLSTALADVETERNRLRAIVDAVRAYIPLIEAAGDGVDKRERLAAHFNVVGQLRQLDGSADIGGAE
jgi:hypothetical protein